MQCDMVKNILLKNSINVLLLLSLHANNTMESHLGGITRQHKLNNIKTE